MKKTKSLIVALASIAMLAACGGTNSNTSSSTISEVESINSSSSVKEESSSVKEEASSSSENSSSSSSEAHVHSFGSWVTTRPATHTAEGEEKRTCGCGESETRTIEKTPDHSFGDWQTTKAATCVDKGEEKRFCSCGESESRETPVNEHTVVGDPSVAPTCDSVGYTEGSHCAVCGTIITAQEEIAKKKHIWKEQIADDDHLKNTPANGYSTREYWYGCRLCGAISDTEYWTRETTAKLTKAPTLNENGMLRIVYADSTEHFYPIPSLSSMYADTFYRKTRVSPENVCTDVEYEYYIGRTNPGNVGAYYGSQAINIMEFISAWHSTELSNSTSMFTYTFPEMHDIDDHGSCSVCSTANYVVCNMQDKEEATFVNGKVIDSTTYFDITNAEGLIRIESSITGTSDYILQSVYDKTTGEEVEIEKPEKNILEFVAETGHTYSLKAMGLSAGSNTYTIKKIPFKMDVTSWLTRTVDSVRENRIIGSIVGGAITVGSPINYYDPATGAVIQTTVLDIIHKGEYVDYVKGDEKGVDVNVRVDGSAWEYFNSDVNRDTKGYSGYHSLKMTQVFTNCKLLTTIKTEGGKSTPFFSGYSPKFVIGGKEYKGRITIPAELASSGVELIFPGDYVEGINVSLSKAVPMELYGNCIRLQEDEGGKYLTFVGYAIVDQNVEVDPSIHLYRGQTDIHTLSIQMNEDFGVSEDGTIYGFNDNRFRAYDITEWKKIAKYALYTDEWDFVWDEPDGFLATDRTYSTMMYWVDGRSLVGQKCTLVLWDGTTKSEMTATIADYEGGIGYGMDYYIDFDVDYETKSKIIGFYKTW